MMSRITYSTPLPSPPSHQLQVVLNVIESGTTFDTETFAANVVEDYVHYYLPENAKLPTFTKAEFIGRLNFMENMFIELKVDVKEIIEAPGVFIIYMGVHATTKGGNTNDPEVVNIVYVAQQADGSYKVTKSKEYVDTAKFAEFGAVVQKEIAQAQA